MRICVSSAEYLQTRLRTTGLKHNFHSQIEGLKKPKSIKKNHFILVEHWYKHK